MLRRDERPRPVTSVPSTTMEPWRFLPIPRSMISRSVVDLPDPDSPTIARVSPARSSKSTPLTAYTEPMRRLRTAPLTSGKVLTRSLTSRTTLRSSRGIPPIASAGRSGTGKSASPPIMRPSISWERTQAAEWTKTSSPLGSMPSFWVGTSGSVLSREGSAFRQASVATGQRSENGQMSGKSMTVGGLPVMGTSGSSLVWSARGIEPSRPIVYGMCGS